MYEVIMTNLVEVVTALLLALIGVFGSWLTMKIGDKKELENIARAQEDFAIVIRSVVNELKQTTVEALKAAHTDGKLTKDEIIMLGEMLEKKSLSLLSKPTENLLNAAGVDIVNFIHATAEDYIFNTKMYE